MAKISTGYVCSSGSAAWAALFVLCAALAVSCAPSSAPHVSDRQVYTFNGATMGTTYTLKVVGSGISAEEQHRIHDVVDARLQAINGMMSTYDPNSEISRFNQWTAPEPFAVSADLMAVLTRAERISNESDGAFDVTVGRLVDLWGFGPTERYRDHPPTDGTVVKALRQCGYTKLHLDPKALTIQKDMPMMYVDLSAIAKGYGVDYAGQALEEAGCMDYMLEVGGEVRTRGRNAQGEWWQIAIEEPAAGQRSVHRVVPLANKAMATSGDYRNFVEEDGVVLSHTIDPKTGRPITHRLASATVLHDECAVADGYATAMMALGPERGMEMAERLGLAVFLIIHDVKNGFVDEASNAFEAYLVSTGTE